MKIPQLKHAVDTTLNYTLFLLGIFLIVTPIWTHQSFGHVTVDQVLSTFSFGEDAVFSADSTFIKYFIIYCLFIPIILAGIISQIKSLRFLKYILIIIGIGLSINEFHFFGFIKSLQRPKEDFFASHYIAPSLVASKSQHTKSLVLIYVESLETTYEKTPLFNHDLLKNIEHLPNSFSFEDYEQMPGADWTIAGVIATQCGVPLKTMTILGPNELGENTKQMLPGAVCLSDLLYQHGYQNIFMKGGSLQFAGFKNFLAAHHYTEQYGREEWLAKGIPESDMGHWGMYDDELFKQAKIRLNDLMKSNKKFNLTILTVDTHGIDGFLNHFCQKQGFSNFQGIVECESKEISSFVSYIEDKGWLDKLNIVVMGDHLAMVNALKDKINLNPSRRIFNAFITDKKFYKKTDVITHFDLLPTLLTLTGFNIKDGRAGLGYSCISPSKKLSLIAQPPMKRLDLMRDQLKFSSQRYNQLWKAENKT